MMEGAREDRTEPGDPLGALVRGARAGVATAEQALCVRYRPFVEKRIREAKAKRNWFWLEDADDAIQDVLVQFLDAIRKGKFVYQGEDALEGYLVRTSFFVAMALKDRLGPRLVSLDQPVGGGGGEDGPGLDVEALARSIPDELQARECMAALYRAIGKLNPNRRAIVERTLLGQRVQDIAEALGKTSNAISVAKFHALEDLRRELEADGFLERCGEHLGLGPKGEAS